MLDRCRSGRRQLHEDCSFRQNRRLIMALSGLQIYKLLPQTNCKECNFPTCLAFAMKLAAKQAELSACPYVSEDAKTQLESAAAPPIRLVTLSSGGRKVAAGNETVLFATKRPSTTRRAGLFVRVRDTEPLETVERIAAEAAQYKIDYVGIDLTVDGMAVQCDSGDPVRFAACVAAVRSVNQGALILAAADAGRAPVRAGRRARRHRAALCRRPPATGRRWPAWPSATRRPWRCAAQRWTNWRS
jgi:acetyl-CoA decarbonylase/synthase complex subunit gamma